MFGVALTTLVCLGTTAPACNGCGRAPVGCAGCAASAGYVGAYAMPVTVVPSAGCGCSSCGCASCGSSPCGVPNVGGMPMGSPMPMLGMGMPPMGGIQMPMGGMQMPQGGIQMPQANGLLLPPAQLGESTQQPGMPPIGPSPNPTLGETRTSPNQAMFVVTVPEDARLLADGTVIPGSGRARVFLTPPLDPAREYFYEMVIEVDRGGKVLRDQQTVKFQAGKTVNVTFTEPRQETPAPPAAGKTARIRVRVPAGATLYVEGLPWSVTTINTPPLDPNRTHYYQLRAEVVHNGKLAVVTREVAFRAGQELTVDLTSMTFAQIAKTSK
jgi:uncharacterized protein (TIGR03000 family)